MPVTEADASRCPICERPTAVAFRPFCSRRCADVDLGNWFSESYAVPVPDDEDEGREASPPRREWRFAGQDGDG